MGMGEGGQEIAELMIPANKVGLIIGTCVQYTVAQYARGLQSDVKCVLNLYRKRRRDDQSSSGMRKPIRRIRTCTHRAIVHVRV